MAGTVTVTRTGDWYEPYAVEVEPAGEKPTRTTFKAAPRAQTFAVEQADRHAATLVYNLDVSPLPTNKGNGETQRGGPRRITAEEMAARLPKVCGKCRTSKPLNQFRVLTRRNATRGQPEVHFGWADLCGDCEAASGQ